jgi:hypothetical protein
MKTFTSLHVSAARRDEGLVVLGALFLSLAVLPALWTVWPQLLWLLR